MGTRRIQIQVLEDRCPALVNTLKRKFSFSCCGHGEKLESVMLTGSNSTQLLTKILDLLLCLWCLGPGASQLAMGIQGRSSCQHLCPGTCPTVGQGPDASGCPACAWPPHTSKTWASQASPGGQEEEEGPAGAAVKNP